MNSDQVKNLVATLLQIASGTVIASGAFDGATWQIVSGAIVAVAVYGWTHWLHKS